MSHFPILALALLFFASSAKAADCPSGLVFIDPSAAVNGSGTPAQPLKTWPSVLSAGACYVQKRGTTYTGLIRITSAPGTPTLPIILSGYGEGPNPIIIGTFDFQMSSHVLVMGFTIKDSDYPGIAVEKGSKNITITQNSISNCKGGIALTNGALGGHVIANNLIFDNVRGDASFPPFGIAVYKIGNTASSPTIITENLVYGNGGSGIELVASYNYVIKNVTYQNGLNTPGSSGIHVYAGSKDNPLPEHGHHNLIAKNITVGNREISDQDGNGIQLDQYASQNQVVQNLSMFNDGPGICLYDANDNYVADNQLLGNSADSSNSHIFRTDFLVANSDGDKIYLSKGNTITANHILGLRKDALAVFVDASSAWATQKNVFKGNYLYNLSGGNVYSWAGTVGSKSTDWNNLIATSGGSGDYFSGLKFGSAAAQTVPLQYSFGASGAVLPIDGANITLQGWSPGAGLLSK